ncbi:MAG: winged helix-turn-helix domain-containing protein [Chloroflexi bacterium CFX6]|nr:winged helix-turn-helix domain-containing protein [Chloroflexi bacterium CFX6]
MRSGDAFGVFSGTSEHGAMRVLQCIGVLAAADAAMSRRELARRVGVSEAAVRKHLPRMTRIAPIEEDDRGRLRVRRDALAAWLRSVGWPVVAMEYEPAPHPITKHHRARRTA